MDGKSLVLRITLILVIVLGYMYIWRYEAAKHPEWLQQNAQTTPDTPPTTGPATSPSPTTTASTTMPTTQGMAIVPTTGPAWSVQTAGTSAGTCILGATDLHNPSFNIGIECQPNGAAIDKVTLTQFNRALNSPDAYAFQTPYTATSDESLNDPLATTSITIDGTTVVLWDKPWQLVSRTTASATYRVTLKHGLDKLELDKTITVPPAQTDGNTPQGYEASVVYTVRDSGDLPVSHNISLEFNGTTMPQAETQKQQTEIVAGYDADGSVVFDHHGAENRDFVPNDRNLPLMWLGSSSNYFNAIIHLPLVKDQPVRFAHALETIVNPEAASSDKVAAVRFTTAGFTVAPGKDFSIPLKVFFGPKSRAVLSSPYYASYPNNYDQTLVLVSGPCAWCTFTWLIDMLVDLLRSLHFVLRDWGLSIIALVCIVRLILHPITKRSQMSMMKMQKMAPEIERLKKKYGDDKEGFAKAQMELYKTGGFNPLLGCLPMFLQMPIFIALWRALQTTFELRQAPMHFTWIRDLSQPDQLIPFPHPFTFFFFTIGAVNILPLAMAVVTFINTKYFMPKPAATTPEQAQQQKMMQWMTLIFPFMFYSFPSGLNLYYLTTTGLGIIESKIIRDHIKAQEEREKTMGPLIVDGPTPKKGKAEPPKKKGFIQRMQEKAEQLAREAEQTKKKRSR